ncbi:MAG: GntR family transcriptional regulator, partial [Bryobacteraceae bacterium]
MQSSGRLIRERTAASKRDRPNGRYEGGSLSEAAYHIIRDRILKGELALGAALSRRKLAAELGMSLLPVAEALQRLERDGLAESRPRVGTRVYQPAADDIWERFEVREALECQAARLFAEKASGREKLELREMAAKMDAMYKRRAKGENAPDFLFEVQNYLALFHLRIAECTGCRALRQTIEKNNLLIFTWLSDAAAHQPALPDRHHSILVEALSQG